MPPLRRTGPSSSAPPPFAPPYFSRQKSLMIDPYLASSRQALEAAVLNPSINAFLFALHVFAFAKIVSSNLLFHRSPVAPGGSCRQRAFISTKHQQPRHVATPRFLTVLLNIGNAKSCIRVIHFIMANTGIKRPEAALIPPNKLRYPPPRTKAPLQLGFIILSFKRCILHSSSCHASSSDFGRPSAHFPCWYFLCRLLRFCMGYEWPPECQHIRVPG